MSYPNPELAAQRARAYWNVDGLPEIFWSLFALLLGLQELTQAFHGPVWLNLTTGGLFLGAVLASRSWIFTLLERVKERWTYPRTGYVPAPLDRDEWLEAHWKTLSIRSEPPTPGSSRRALWMPAYEARSIPAIAASLALLLLMDFWPFRWAPVVLSFLAAWMVRFVHRPEFPFHPIVYWSMPVAGLLLSILDVPIPLRLPWVLAAFGSTGLLTGVFTLCRYLSKHPSPQAQE